MPFELIPKKAPKILMDPTKVYLRSRKNMGAAISAKKTKNRVGPPPSAEALQLRVRRHGRKEPRLGRGYAPLRSLGYGRGSRPPADHAVGRRRLDATPAQERLRLPVHRGATCDVRLHGLPGSRGDVHNQRIARPAAVPEGHRDRVAQRLPREEGSLIHG